MIYTISTAHESLRNYQLQYSKKALDWLKTNKVDYDFRDFKKLGVSTEKLQEWDSKPVTNNS